MNQVGLEEEINRLQKELQLSGGDVDRRLLDLRVEIDRLRLELTAIRKFLGAANPAFAEMYPRILEQTIQEIDPELD